ncbi:hypothetical protein [Halomonas sp. BC04]|uniref:hypothetical protein n=1 Tax=Halomonas sp. BC04 TaxID=1403540 RepID=UPI0022AF78EB|nr:hypothetical protein [Halomonas sp. BC04]
MLRTAKKPRTLVYSCSGCSDVAQLANDVAWRSITPGRRRCPALPAWAVACPGW